MGRRALRGISPQLDLSRHLYRLDDLPTPWQRERMFGRVAPVEIELGSGKGLFLQRTAANAPEHDLLGIEVAHRYARFAAARLARHGITNACVIDGDGTRFLREWVQDEEVAAVHVYFPDPWWKKRHRKRRVMRPDVLRDIYRVLEVGGRLHFWTDVEPYFRETIELIGHETSLTGPFDVPEREAEHDLDYRTHFERRMRQHGVAVYRSQFEKPSGR